MQKQMIAADNEDVLEISMVAVAAALADTSRVKILCALMDGRAWTATELSAVADVACSTASAHLARLVQSRLISCLSQGRHRYYRLAGGDIAQLIETMMGVSWRRVAAPEPSTPADMRYARTCYDHLAGEVAVQIYDAMRDAQWITTDGAALTDTGRQHLIELGIEPDAGTRRKHCCACLDWSERRFHLGGYIGAALLQHGEAEDWLVRTPGYRMVTITPKGRMMLNRHFKLAL
ncbi:metalloregulator ArsR/SmtB family transcription factor [Erwinia rhapontici]|uniref:ArsR/SmtB family transcription factor n=1 Tax=Erwinia rhapontici TaxID=55212 RepID=UPI001D0D8B6C|nr:metalloregulator ArsR/SmtB family transcription factor [Erwinia rhapontici]UDQ81993.1 metalloregulator ArsR/SmtB family transcription factor [Erwinia rhapontici]